MGHEVPIQGDARTDSGAYARVDTADLPGKERCNHTRGDLAGPHPHAAVGAATASTGEGGAIHQGKIVATAAGGIPGIGEAILGAASVDARVLLHDSVCKGRRSSST